MITKLKTSEGLVEKVESITEQLETMGYNFCGLKIQSRNVMPDCLNSTIDAYIEDTNLHLREKAHECALDYIPVYFVYQTEQDGETLNIIHGIGLVLESKNAREEIKKQVEKKQKELT